MHKGFYPPTLLMYSILFLLLFTSFNILAQEKKPKVALVLSGGGAKGLAHIPLLQTLDSLQIVPDLIVGNSMGSVVGGLYAMGYSGDSIANIVKEANWEALIGGRVSLQNVSVEEKTEFGRYLIDLDYVKGKIKLGKFLLNDQNLRQFISNLTFPCYAIDNFDKLPIPFRAVATDIVHGKEIILKNGSLAMAMRASMSLPGVFSPVPYEDGLLVDGAILNNFPVDVAKKMGADIIIGSDVGDGMMKKDELESISSLLFQAGMLSSHLKNASNRALCDILINHTEHLTFGTSDFENSAAIYKEGQAAVADQREALAALSERLKPYFQTKIRLPFAKTQQKLDTIVYKNISRTNLPLVKARMNIQSGKIYSRPELIEGINRAMGTTVFREITFEPIAKNGKLGLQLNGFERSKHQVKGALHYDNFHGVGVLVNYTGRNILGAASRTLVSLDVAEMPRFRVQHQKNFGADRDWWWRTEAMGQLLTQEVFLNGATEEEIRYRYFDFDNQLNRNITSLTSYIGIHVNFQNTYLSPKIELDGTGTPFKLNEYNLDVFQVGAHYVNNTLNLSYFPTEGTFLKMLATRSLATDIKVAFANPNTPHEKGQLSNFTKFGFEYEMRLPFSETLSGIVGASGNYIVVDDEDESDVSFAQFGLGAKYSLGGNQLNPRRDSFIFAGLDEGELSVMQFTSVSLGLQYNFKPKLYLIPHVEVAVVGFNGLESYVSNAFTAKSQWQDFTGVRQVLSSGLTVGYNSILGPINFDVSWVNDVDKIRFFFGVGFPLNRSN